jgi:hypothetical protein
MGSTLTRHLPVATCIGCGARSHSAECSDGCSDRPMDVVDVGDLAAVASRAEDLEERVTELRALARMLASETPLSWPTAQERARAAIQPARGITSLRCTACRASTTSAGSTSTAPGSSTASSTAIPGQRGAPRAAGQPRHGKQHDGEQAGRRHPERREGDSAPRDHAIAQPGDLLGDDESGDHTGRTYRHAGQQPARELGAHRRPRG